MNHKTREAARTDKCIRPETVGIMHCVKIILVLYFSALISCFNPDTVLEGLGLEYPVSSLCKQILPFILYLDNKSSSPNGWAEERIVWGSARKGKKREREFSDQYEK